MLKDHPVLLEETKSKFIEIENISSNTTNYIDNIKQELISVDELNEYGFLKNGRRVKMNISSQLIVWSGTNSN